MEDQKKKKLRYPDVKTGIAKIQRIVPFKVKGKENGDYIIHLKSFKWESIEPIYVNGKATRETEQNSKGLSRVQQLGFTTTFKEGDYIMSSIAHIIVDETGYEKNGKLVPHTTQNNNKKERLEFRSVETASKEAFDELFRDFIAVKYESEIDNKKTASPSWSFNDCLDFYVRKHRNENK